jgi:hypothetical protein
LATCVYYVESGNTFEHVSIFCTGTKDSVKAIKMVTGLDVLKVGLILRLQVYKVQPGDSLSIISHAFKVSMQDLMDGNNIGLFGVIQPGQKLIIPVR